MSGVYVRAQVKRINDDSLKVRRIDFNRTHTCERPHWLPTGVKIGSHVLLLIRGHYLKIVQVLSIGDGVNDGVLKCINKWEDYTWLDAFTIDQKNTYFAEDAMSMHLCDRHDKCIQIGIHILDIASFHPNCFELEEKYRELKTKFQIKDKIYQRTGSSIAIRGFKPRCEQPCISTFFHTGVDDFNHYDLVPSVIKVQEQYSYEEIVFQLKHSNDRRPDFNWKLLFEYGWKYRIFDNKEFDIYTFHDTWVWQQTTESYLASLLVQIYVRITTKTVVDYLSSKKVPFPAIKFHPKITEELAKEFMKYIPYSIPTKCYYEFNKEQLKEPLPDNYGKVKDENIVVLVLKHIWDKLADAAKAHDVVMCGSLLAAFHIYPFLVEVTAQAGLSFKRKLVTDFSERLEENRKTFSKIYVNFTRPGRELESILIQKLIHHSIASSNREGISDMIKSDFFGPLEKSDDESDDDESDDEEQEDVISTEQKENAVNGKVNEDLANNEEIEDQDESQQEKENESNVSQSKSSIQNEKLEVLESLSLDDPKEQDPILRSSLVEQPEHLESRPEVLGCKYPFQNFGLEPHQLECYKIESKDWLTMQDNLKAMGSQIPFKSECKTRLFNSILDANFKKQNVPTFTTAEVNKFKPFNYRNKPYISNSYLKGRYLYDIWTASPEIHICQLHSVAVSSVIPYYVQPMQKEKWKEHCLNGPIYTKIKLKPSGNNFFEIINLKGTSLPTFEEYQFVCVTMWLHEEKYVFYAHGEYACREKSSKNYVKILTYLDDVEENPLLDHKSTFTLQFF